LFVHWVQRALAVHREPYSWRERPTAKSADVDGLLDLAFAFAEDLAIS